MIHAVSQSRLQRILENRIWFEISSAEYQFAMDSHVVAKWYRFLFSDGWLGPGVYVSTYHIPDEKRVHYLKK
jgi:hypothetical protein